MDDHTEPLGELRRLHGVAKQRFIPFSRAFPTTERPFGITDRTVIEGFIERNAGKPLEEVIALPIDRSSDAGA